MNKKPNKHITNITAEIKPTKNKKLTLYYATNRNHCGDQRHPNGYGTEFSKSDGAKLQNLRFGELTLEADENKINECLNENADGDKGNGEGLSEYLTNIADQSKITAYEEKADNNNVEKLGSLSMFDKLKQAMIDHSDVLIYIHGFNVDWDDAVGAALALQTMVNQKTTENQNNILVVLFSWPSNGRALPWVSYYRDRDDASNIAGAKSFARGLLKLRDYLSNIEKKDRCQRKIHLLCHSMGNYVLQHSLKAMINYTNNRLPLIFGYIFMCAADVDDDVFENDMQRLPEITRRISIYHNEEDRALWLSDNTKGNSDRLGDGGINSFNCQSNKIHQIDCTEIVEQDIAEHSYYLNGLINKDIRLSLLGISVNDKRRNREGQKQTNSWKIIKK